MNTSTKQISITTQHAVIGALDDCATACDAAFSMLGVGEDAAKRARHAAELMRQETNTPEDRTVAKEDTTNLNWLTSNAAFNMYAATERISQLFAELTEQMTAAQRHTMTTAMMELEPFMLGMKQRTGNDASSDGDEPDQSFARHYERVVQAAMQSAKRFTIIFTGIKDGNPTFRVVKRELLKAEEEAQTNADLSAEGVSLRNQARAAGDLVNTVSNFVEHEAYAEAVAKEQEDVEQEDEA